MCVCACEHVHVCVSACPVCVHECVCVCDKQMMILHCIHISQKYKH